jgi:hypothetical protein
VCEFGNVKIPQDDCLEAINYQIPIEKNDFVFNVKPIEIKVQESFILSIDPERGAEYNRCNRA